MSAQAHGWKKISDPGDGRRGLTALVGPFSLSIFSGARGQVLWHVKGPDVDGAMFDAHGVAESVEDARTEAVDELKRRWATLDGAIRELEHDVSDTGVPAWRHRPGMDGDVATADIGPFRLYALPNQFAIRGPRLNREGRAASTKEAQRTAMLALRTHLKELPGEEIEGHRITRLLAELDALARDRH